jgi:transcriptional regulator with GAF, ATPase, and Fis domain
MNTVTQSLSPRGPLLRLDDATGTLRARRYELEITGGADAGRKLLVTGRSIVGTSPNADLQLNDPTVSRHHVELDPRPEGVRIRDLESRNGTTLGGLKLTEGLLENLGDVFLRLGNTELRLRASEDELGEGEPLSGFGGLVGQSASMRKLFGLLSRVAPSDATVLVLGETGTGKEGIARALHESSTRRNGPYVVVDCGTLSESLAESELFGHTRGAFTGAVGDRTGAFADANGGTIFLDEIGDLPLELQPKLLRVLESGMIRRVGESQHRRIDVRVIAATHRNLEEAVKEGTFRRDLYYRLAVVPVRVPPLRERLEDIGALTAHFVRLQGATDFALPPSLLAQLEGYAWPGNVRELRNVVSCALAGGEVELQPPSASGPVTVSDPQLKTLPFKEAKDLLVDGFTRDYLVHLHEVSGGNISEIARRAGLARTHVHRLVKRFKLGE